MGDSDLFQLDFMRHEAKFRAAQAYVYEVFGDAEATAAQGIEISDEQRAHAGGDHTIVVGGVIAAESDTGRAAADLSPAGIRHARSTRRPLRPGLPRPNISRSSPGILDATPMRCARRCRTRPSFDLAPPSTTRFHRLNVRPAGTEASGDRSASVGRCELDDRARRAHR